jgi:hypothetical protein
MWGVFLSNATGSLMNTLTKQLLQKFLPLLIAFSLVSCSILPEGLGFQPTASLAVSQSNDEVKLTSVVFYASLQQGMPQEDLTLEILDEVTGLALNPQRFLMKQLDDGRYQAEINFPIGSVVKYRYLRGDSPYHVEYTAAGNQVRYRLAVVNGPQEVNDLISAWTDYAYNGPTGRIHGQVINADSNAPYANALVIGGGMQTLTASDGTFLLEGLPPGLHNLTVYSLDGSFDAFQQGAIVAQDATTPAMIKVTPASFVNITFVVHAPQVNIKGLPIRIVGNTYNLGNTFADLEGGVSVIASRAPLMTFNEDGTYSLTLSLPIGLDLRYKYSVGDGFWNAEHAANGVFVTRQLVVPAEDTTIDDTVTAWSAGDNQPVSFIVTVPASTPADDLVSIQFNPYGWTAPIPMWKVAENQWLFVLYSPLNMVSQMGYRYCRNDQCGAADDALTTGATAAGRSLTITMEGQTIQDTVENWFGLNASASADLSAPADIAARGQGYIAGVQIDSAYKPEWQAYQFWGMNKIQQLAGNTVILTPSWSVTNAAIPVIEPVTGKDPLWFDATASIQLARQNSLEPVLYPQIQDGSDSLWAEAHSSDWWDRWFDRYQVFAVNFADMATQTNVQTLILGGPQILPALPSGILADGSESGVPADASQRWLSILQAVRERYHGQIAFALPYPWTEYMLPTDILEQVDLLYVEFSAGLDNTPPSSVDELMVSMNTLLDDDVYGLYTNFAKPIVLGIKYPSAPDAAAGCANENGVCVNFDAMSAPQTQMAVDLQVQADIYSAVLATAGSRDWITGIVSQGYYLPAQLQDASTSIYGKPAEDVLWYWFSKLTGKS